MKHTYSVLAFLFASLCASAQNYTLNGDATALGGDCYQLTPTINNASGTVWYDNQVDLNQPFNIQFEMNLGSIDEFGADGICFVLQTVGVNAIGESGGGLGYLNFGTSLGIEFDTWQNGEHGDPSYDHIAIEKNGDINHNSANNIAAPVQMSPFNQNTEDGANHVVQITWNPETQVISVFFDCAFRTQGNVDLVNSIFGGQNLVYWGFTAATGGSVNDQRVCLQQNILNVGDEVRLCPGGSSILQSGASADGVYAWSPTTFLDDPTSATPLCTPNENITYTVTFTNLCGQQVQANITVYVDPLQISVPTNLNITCTSATPLATATSNFGANTDYTWTTTNGNFTNGSSSNQITILDGGNYTVIGNVNNECFDTLSFSVSVDTSAYEVSLGEDANLTCYAPSLTLAAEYNGNNGIFNWRRNGTIINTATSQSISVNNTGIYAVAVTNPANGCVGRDTITINSNFSEPTITVGLPDTLSCIKRNVTIDDLIIMSDGEYLVNWSTTTGALVSTPSTQNAIVSAAGLYTITATDEVSGCSSSEVVEVLEGENLAFDVSKLIFPNVITPNGDTYNGKWQPMVLGMSATATAELFDRWELQIFNRWGTKVFESNSSFNAWTASDQDEGTYYYTLLYHTFCGGSQSGEENGVISVLR